MKYRCFYIICVLSVFSFIYESAVSKTPERAENTAGISEYHNKIADIIVLDTAYTSEIMLLHKPGFEGIYLIVNDFEENKIPQNVTLDEILTYPNVYLTPVSAGLNNGHFLTVANGSGICPV